LADCKSFSQIDFQNVADTLLERVFSNVQDSASTRGNYQESYGITSLNMKVEATSEVAKPQCVRTTERWHVELMVIMSSLMREIMELKGESFEVPSICLERGICLVTLQQSQHPHQDCGWAPFEHR
jgi:hypothetical protein